MTGWDYTDVKYGIRVWRVNGIAVYYQRWEDDRDVR